MKIGVPLRPYLCAFLVLLHPGLVQAQTSRQIFIRVNQLGYRPTDAKSAIALSTETIPDKFSVVNAATGQSAFEGMTKAIAGRWGQFGFHAEIDFSAFRKPGKYFVRIGGAESTSFEIVASAYSAIPDQLLEFMRQQIRRVHDAGGLASYNHPYGYTSIGLLPQSTQDANLRTLAAQM
ncbi:MAG: cellulase N-terminal Ig-like domain-containing protein, partial [Pyrinomonadaceae bacterium]